MANEWVVGPGEAGLRLDQWLVQRAAVSRKQAKRYLDDGRVRVNGRLVRLAKWTLRTGDRVTCRSQGNERGRQRAASHRQIDILFEDHDLIAVAKPPGVVVVPLGEQQDVSLVDMVRAYLVRRHPGARGTYVRALHRLDRETSGIVVLAKTRAGEALLQVFKRHAVRREYLAVVHGAMAQENVTIALPLRKGEFGRGRKVAPAATADGGKPAVTHGAVEERYPQATLLRLRVETGRTHQIRVHLASLGHPLLGDRRYGPPSDPLRTPRLALHATRLAFRHPGSGEPLDLRLPPPADFTALIDRLRTMV